MSAADVRPVDRAVVSAACSIAGIDCSSLEVLRQHATGVYLLPAGDQARDGIVARVNRGADRRRAATAVAVTRWLTGLGFPAVEPAEVAVDQPVVVDDDALEDGAADEDVPHDVPDVLDAARDVSVTFWRYYAQQDRPAPPPAELGALLRQLHEISAEPPVALERYQPLTRLGAVLAESGQLPDEDREWLLKRRAELLAEYERIDSELGVGLIHGDAYPGNMLWDGDRVILGDWDEVAYGPRELDLVNTHQGARFGRTQADRDAFSAAYGWDITSWPGFSVLRAMRDLHTLAAFIERSFTDDARVTAELQHRLATLRHGDAGAFWQAA